MFRARDYCRWNAIVLPAQRQLCESDASSEDLAVAIVESVENPGRFDRTCAYGAPETTPACAAQRHVHYAVASAGESCERTTAAVQLQQAAYGRVSCAGQNALPRPHAIAIGTTLQCIFAPVQATFAAIGVALPM